MGKLANDGGAPAQPPWLQGYRTPEAEPPDELRNGAGYAHSWVQPDSVREIDVAGPGDNDAPDHRNGDHVPPAENEVAAGDRWDWSPPQPDPPAADPVEARATELLRLLESGRPPSAGPDPAESGRHRAVDEHDNRRDDNHHNGHPTPPVSGAPAPRPAVQPPVHPVVAPPVRASGYTPVRPLDEAAVANPARFAPQSGWRRALYRASAGRVNAGDSARDRRRDELFARIRQPIRGDFRIAVLSIKGGVGKTTTTLGLGSAFATIRTDRVIAVDANPDRGTLAQRIDDPSDATVHDLLSDPNIARYSDVRYYTRMSSSRLEVLGSPLDPAISEAFGEVDYRRTVDILQSYYNVILTDCGTGIMHSAMTGVLDLAHAIVVVSSPALDAARSASATLDWLMNHGYSGLVRESHLVLSAARPGDTAVRMDKVYEHFESRCRSVHLIPFDSHLAEGAEVDMELLKPATVQSYIELAGAISEKFARLRPNA